MLEMTLNSSFILEKNFMFEILKLSGLQYVYSKLKLFSLSVSIRKLYSAINAYGVK